MICHDRKDVNLHQIAPRFAPKFKVKNMATISKRTNGWRVQVRRKGISRSATFHRKIDAQQWALKIETEIDSGKFDVPDMTFAELVDKYIKEVTIHKKGARHETLRLLRLCDMDIGCVKLINLSENDFIKWRDERIMARKGK